MPRALLLSSLVLACLACGGEAPPPFDGDTGSDADSDGDTDGDSDGDADGDSDGDSDGDADGDSDGDADGDSDTCVGNGHDEDGDGRDDNCDNCPTIPNAGQPDADQDGLGDQCEASWNADLLSGILVFDPLLDMQADWAPSGGTWAYGGDVVAGSSQPYGGNYYRAPYVPQGVYSVEATFRFTEPAPAGENYAGILFAVHEESENVYWYTCLFSRDTDTLSVWRYAGGSSVGGVDSAEVAAPAADGQWHRVRVTYNGSAVICAFTDEAGGSGELTVDAGDLWPSMAGNGGLRVYNERAQYTSFAIYQ